MGTGLLTLEVITYSFALWLGLYLIGRNLAVPRLRYAGLGLIAYALSLGTDLLANHAPTPALALTLTRLHWPLLFLPAIFWFLALLHLMPDDSPWPLRLTELGQQGLLLLALPFYLFSAGTNLIFDFTTSPPQPGPAYPLFAGLVLLPMLVALLLIGHIFRTTQPKKPLGLLLAATIFFGLSAGLLLYPLEWLPRLWLLLAISGDLGVLGLAIAWLDAFEEGETLLPDFTHAFDSAFFASLLFGGLIVLTILFSTGLTFSMLLLLLSTLSAAIAYQTFADPLQTAIDRLALAAFPRLRQERANLRAVATALPRASEVLDPALLDEAKFSRLTRRALSHLGDISRLATSPLTRLPLIDARLTQREARDDTLERAAELKSLLTDSICRLKPRDKGDFGTTDEWRHYNALYFPYVVGLKPYSRRADYPDNGLDETEQEALDWLRTYIPERTLYNWQNAAAKLVAQDLRERMKLRGDEG